LPGKPVGPPTKWAATSNVEVGQTTYPVNRGRAGKQGRGEKRAMDKVTTWRRWKKGVEWGRDHTGALS